PLGSIVKMIGALAGSFDTPNEYPIVLSTDRALLQRAAATAGPRVSVYGAGAKLTGSPLKDSPEQYFRWHDIALLDCYMDARASRGVAWPLEVPLRFTLSSSGAASDIEAAEPADAALRACLQAAVAKIKFSGPERGTTKVTTKLQFEATNMP